MRQAEQGAAQVQQETCGQLASVATADVTEEPGLPSSASLRIDCLRIRSAGGSPR